MMLDEPLKPPQAKTLIREILIAGEVTYSKPHAEERLKKWNLTTLDCVNVLRGGVVAEGEFENGSWRYRVYTPRISVVVRFESEDILQIVTAWRET
jgi:hypothetical protein